MLGFKGERGYSAYEIAVQNGFIGSERDWLAQLGTTNVYEQKSTTYRTTNENQSTFELPEGYTSNSMITIYVNGLRLSASEYSIDTTNKIITLAKPIESVGSTVEVSLTIMTTTNLPIVTAVTESSTDEIVPSAKCVYDIKTSLENTSVPAGGLKGEALFKASDSNNDVIWESLLDKIYPVGSVYISMNSNNPADLFGGVWEQIKDRFLLASGDKYEEGSIGGESEHKLTTDELPRHTHLYNNADLNPEGKGWTLGNGGLVQLYTQGIFSSDTNSVGQDVAHNNMPPYLTVFVWQRIS